MITVYLSQPVTRRKQYHFVYAESGERLFLSRDAADVFAWLAEHGEDEFWLVTHDGKHHVKWVDRRPPW